MPTQELSTPATLITRALPPPRRIPPTPPRNTVYVVERLGRFSRLLPGPGPPLLPLVDRVVAAYARRVEQSTPSSGLLAIIPPARRVLVRATWILRVTHPRKLAYRVSDVDRCVTMLVQVRIRDALAALPHHVHLHDSRLLQTLSHTIRAAVDETAAKFGVACPQFRLIAVFPVDDAHHRSLNLAHATSVESHHHHGTNVETVLPELPHDQSPSSKSPSFASLPALPPRPSPRPSPNQRHLIAYPQPPQPKPRRRPPALASVRPPPHLSPENCDNAASSLSADGSDEPDLSPSPSSFVRPNTQPLKELQVSARSLPVEVSSVDAKRQLPVNPRTNPPVAAQIESDVRVKPLGDLSESNRLTREQNRQPTSEDEETVRSQPADGVKLLTPPTQELLRETSSLTDESSSPEAPPKREVIYAPPPSPITATESAVDPNELPQLLSQKLGTNTQNPSSVPDDPASPPSIPSLSPDALVTPPLASMLKGVPPTPHSQLPPSELGSGSNSVSSAGTPPPEPTEALPLMSANMNQQKGENDMLSDSSGGYAEKAADTIPSPLQLSASARSAAVLESPLEACASSSSTPAVPSTPAPTPVSTVMNPDSRPPAALAASASASVIGSDQPRSHNKPSAKAPTNNASNLALSNSLLTPSSRTATSTMSHSRDDQSGSSAAVQNASSMPHARHSPPAPGMSVTASMPPTPSLPVTRAVGSEATARAAPPVGATSGNRGHVSPSCEAETSGPVPLMGPCLIPPPETTAKERPSATRRVALPLAALAVAAPIAVAGASAIAKKAAASREHSTANVASASTSDPYGDPYRNPFVDAEGLTQNGAQENRSVPPGVGTGHSSNVAPRAKHVISRDQDVHGASRDTEYGEAQALEFSNEAAMEDTLIRDGATDSDDTNHARRERPLNSSQMRREPRKRRQHLQTASLFSTVVGKAERAIRFAGASLTPDLMDTPMRRIHAQTNTPRIGAVPGAGSPKGLRMGFPNPFSSKAKPEVVQREDSSVKRGDSEIQSSEGLIAEEVRDRDLPRRPHARMLDESYSHRDGKRMRTTSGEEVISRKEQTRRERLIEEMRRVRDGRHLRDRSSDEDSVQMMVDRRSDDEHPRISDEDYSNSGANSRRRRSRSRHRRRRLRHEFDEESGSDDGYSSGDETCAECGHHRHHGGHELSSGHHRGRSRSRSRRSEGSRQDRMDDGSEGRSVSRSRSSREGKGSSERSVDAHRSGRSSSKDHSRNKKSSSRDRKIDKQQSSSSRSRSRDGKRSHSKTRSSSRKGEGEDRKHKDSKSKSKSKHRRGSSNADNLDYYRQDSRLKSIYRHRLPESDSGPENPIPWYCIGQSDPEDTELEDFEGRSSDSGGGKKHSKSSTKATMYSSYGRRDRRGRLRRAHHNRTVSFLYDDQY